MEPRDIAVDDRTGLNAIRSSLCDLPIEAKLSFGASVLKPPRQDVTCDRDAAAAVALSSRTTHVVTPSSRPLITSLAPNSQIVLEIDSLGPANLASPSIDGPPPKLPTGSHQTLARQSHGLCRRDARLKAPGVATGMATEQSVDGSSAGAQSAPARTWP
jgi:hypothetical protein